MLNQIRFWTRDGWRMLKTIGIIFVIAVFSFTPVGLLARFSSLSDVAINWIAVFSYFAGAILFWWLCFAKLPPRKENPKT